MRSVPPPARVLDAGAGTGLAGELLAGRGYTNLVAMDLSESMLREAARKLVEVSVPEKPMPSGEPGVYHQVWVYRVR